MKRLDSPPIILSITSIKAITKIVQGSRAGSVKKQGNKGRLVGY